MSTDYTHFTNLAFTNLFARGADNSEVLLVNSSGIWVGTLNLTNINVANGSSTATSVGFIHYQTSGMWINSAALNVASSSSLNFYRANSKVFSLSSSGATFTGNIFGSGTSFNQVASTSGNVDHNVQNTNTSSTTANARFTLQTGTGGGSPMAIYNQAGSGVYTVGVDRVDSKFKIGAGSGTFATPLLTVSTSTFVVAKTLSASNFSGTSSGTNTGDQTITLTGNVTGSGTGSFATTIANSAVTNVMIAASAAISGSKIASASSSAAGVVSTGTQSFAGTKTFTTALAGTNVASASTSASGVITTGAQSIAGTKTFVSQLIGKGTVAADSAAAGYIGEVISSSVSTPGVSITNNQWTDVTNIVLTAGDWDISVMANFSQTAAGTVTGIGYGIHTTSGNAIGGTLGDNYTFSTQVPTTASYAAAAVPSYRVSISGSTTYYLKVYATFGSGSCKGFGRISARRER